MPEKVKIHLKNNLSMERNPPAATSKATRMTTQSAPKATQNTTKASNVVSSKNGRFDKSKKTTQNIAVSSAGKFAKTEASKTGFETGKSGLETGKTGSETRQQQIRRARSVGPVVEAAQREISHLDLTKVLTGNPVKSGHLNRPESPSLITSKERRSRSRGRTGSISSSFPERFLFWVTNYFRTLTKARSYFAAFQRPIL